MKQTLTLLATLLAVSLTTSHATEYFVSANGNDANAGTKSTPLATVQAGVNKLQPGDTLLIRGGIYRETVTFPRSGTAGNFITLKPYQSEKVVISGCDPVTGWTLHDPVKKIWKAPMPWTLGLGRNQLFCGGQVMIEARHPNVPAPGLEMFVAGLSPLWPTYGEFSIPRETRVSQPGRIVSKLLDGQPDDYWKGAIYCGVHFEGWCAQTGVIESSKSGEIQVGDRTHTWWFGNAYEGKFPQEHEEGRGIIVGHMHALDVPNEWHWQENSIYLITPDGAEPRTVEAKRRQLAFDLSGREHIRIEGLSIHAASMRLEDSAHCVVDHCNLSYISHYTQHYGIGQITKGRDTIKSGETGIFVGGHDNAFLNCSVRFSAGTGFHLRGYHHTIHNCLIDEVSYVGHYLNAITDAVSDFPDYENFLVGGHVITFNTMRNAGRHFFNFYGNGPSSHSRDRGPMDYAATLFAHNHLYNGMLLTRDAGFITSFQSSGGTLNGQHSQVAYNVMHDCYDIAAMRWNILGMVYLDNGSREVDVHHNLFWAAPGSLQSGIWFNPPNVNVSDRDNLFHGLFTRTSAELRPEDFPNGKPFRFGHDFSVPPAVPEWPQLETVSLDPKSVSSCSPGITKNASELRGLKDGDWFCLGDIDFSRGWQSAVMQFASDAKAINTDRSVRAAPRHQKPSDPLVLDAAVSDGSEGITKNWMVSRAANGGWMRFNQVPLAGGYQRFRIVYGTTSRAPRHVEVRLDKPDGPVVGQASLPPTDKPRLKSIQTFEEAVGELSATATGTHDLYFLFHCDDGKPVAEFEYFRLERARSAVPLPKNDVRFEIRVGSKEGEKIGEFFPRCTGGTDQFRNLVATLEPTHGTQPMFVVIRSAFSGPIGIINRISLQKAQPTSDDRAGLGIPPRHSGWGHLVWPEPANRPCSQPSDHYRQTTGTRPYFRATHLSSPVIMDAKLQEWTGQPLELKQTLEGATVEESPVQAWVGYDDHAFYLAMRNPIRDAQSVHTSQHLWGATDAVEIAFQNAEATPPGPILSLRGWPDGYFQAPDLAGVPEPARKRLAEAVTYRAAIGTEAWTCEWRIPFDACGLTPASASLLLCNLTVRNTAQNSWRSWNTACGSTYDLHNGGSLIFGSGEHLLTSQLKAGLEVWLDAADATTIEKESDGKVRLWKDKSGKGRHAVQATDSFRPIYNASGLNGKATLQFDDARKTRLELPDLSEQPMSATVFAVISNPEPGLPNNQHQRVFTASDGKQLDYLCGLCCSIPGAQTGGPRQLYYEGKNRWARNVRIGCFSPIYQTFFKGEISELLVFGRPLAQEERNRVMVYLVGKWGL